MRRLCLFLIVALTPILGLAQAPARQTPQEPVATFRAGVRAIQVDAVVTDEEGNPVRGLTVEDFEITERGQPSTDHDVRSGRPPH